MSRRPFFESELFDPIISPVEAVKKSILTSVNFSRTFAHVVNEFRAGKTFSVGDVSKRLIISDRSINRYLLMLAEAGFVVRGGGKKRYYVPRPELVDDAEFLKKVKQFLEAAYK